MPNTMPSKSGKQGILLFSWFQRKDIQFLTIENNVICGFLISSLNYDALPLSYT